MMKYENKLNIVVNLKKQERFLAEMLIHSKVSSISIKQWNMPTLFSSARSAPPYLSVSSSLLFLYHLYSKTVNKD